jgi:hypothetical protein
MAGCWGLGAHSEVSRREVRYAPWRLKLSVFGETSGYAYFPAHGTVALFVAFGKSERSDLSAVQARAIAKALEGFETELRHQSEQQG